MARNANVPLNQALDLIAREEGFARWSMLSSRMATGSLSETMLSRLEDGDLFLLAGRPGHGKTTLGLHLLLDAIRDDRKAVFFTLDFTEQQARKHVRSLEGDIPAVGDARTLLRQMKSARILFSDICRGRNRERWRLSTICRSWISNEASPRWRTRFLLLANSREKLESSSGSSPRLTARSIPRANAYRISATFVFLILSIWGFSQRLASCTTAKPSSKMWPKLIDRRI